MPAEARPAAADATWSAATATPLLHELVRALRARRLCERGDPGLAAILARAAAIWGAALGRARGPLELAPLPVPGPGAGTSFALASGERLADLTLAQLAGELARAGIQRLEFQPGLRPAELSAFVEILAAATAPGALPADYVRSFERAQIQSIALVYASPGPEPEPPKPEPAARAAVRRFRQAVEADPVAASLADLARSQDVIEFQRALEQLRQLLDPRLEAGDYVDAYAVALALGRHASSPRHSTAIREAAAESLQALVLADPAFVRIPLERIYGPHSEAAIEALQLLAALGPRLVPHLLEAHEHAPAPAQQYTSAILLAMGDSVYPALMQQLESAEARRAVLTAELLGEMQNPRALSALSAALSARRPVALRLAAAVAVARIGGERARVVLEAHGLALDDEVSRACRAALRDWQSRQGQEDEA